MIQKMSHMKILQTISGFGARSGGTSTCTYDLMKALHTIGCNADLLTTDVNKNFDTLMGEGEAWIKVVDNDKISPYGYSKSTKKYLKKTEYDIYHTNGLWMHCNHITCSIARRKGKPYVITPHGMLYPHAIKRSYWKKWPLIKLWFKKDIMMANCIHATCKQEMENIRAFGYKGPIAIIGNPANIPPYIDKLKGRDKERRFSTFGFLGRLHPIKKVENLLYGVAKCSPEKRKNIRLVIMGKGDEQYEQFLRKEIERLGLTKNVEFKGFINGRDKFEQLSQLHALFVPSDFENFGMIVTEALACKTPVFASLGTPWEELNNRKCGWWMDRSPENIANIMSRISDMTNEEIDAMGERGRKFVEEKFTAESVAEQIKELYKWIANNNNRPDFIY